MRAKCYIRGHHDAETCRVACVTADTTVSRDGCAIISDQKDNDDRQWNNKT